MNKLEEEIEILEEMIENANIENMDMNNCFGGEHIEALEHILSDYKRVLEMNEVLLKENEELKQDRNNNYQMIALAQNEMLGYMQGYEDGKKLKRSAVACVVENQQYYIIKKEIERYKEKIEKLQKESEELKDFKKQVTEVESTNFIKYKNYISKQEVKDKIEEEIKYHEKNILDIENITMLKSKTAKEETEIEFNKYAIVVLNKMLQELIEESEEK